MPPTTCVWCAVSATTPPVCLKFRMCATKLASPSGTCATAMCGSGVCTAKASQEGVPWPFRVMQPWLAVLSTTTLFHESRTREFWLVSSCALPFSCRVALPSTTLILWKAEKLVRTLFLFGVDASK